MVENEFGRGWFVLECQVGEKPALKTLVQPIDNYCNFSDLGKYTKEKMAEFSLPLAAARCGDRGIATVFFDPSAQVEQCQKTHSPRPKHVRNAIEKRTGRPSLPSNMPIEQVHFPIAMTFA
ncbi:hypothetical protein ACFL0Y_04850 [Patescibacteria group bacterium]